MEAWKLGSLEAWKLGSLEDRYDGIFSCGCWYERVSCTPRDHQNSGCIVSHRMSTSELGERM